MPRGSATIEVPHLNHAMSLNISTRLPLRSLSSAAPTKSISTSASAQRRQFFFKALRNRTRGGVDQSQWRPATSGPSRPTKAEELKRRQEEELQQKSQHEKLIKEEASITKADGGPARNIEVIVDGDKRVFDTVFLRDSCKCSQCRDPDSKQKLYQTSDIPENLEGSYKLVEDPEAGPSIEVEWKTDVKGYGLDHRTRLSIDYLRRAHNTELELRGGVRYDDRVLWDRKRIERDNKWVDYNEYMSQDSVLFDALTHLNRYGLLFIRNVPESETSVVDIASRIGTLKDTFYGRTWDVRSKPKAENIAYTPQFLGLHMDLLYTSNPPHLQLLHSLRARCPGGESFFSDSFHAAKQLHQQSQSKFRTLCTFPVTYHYHHPTHHYQFTRPVIDRFPTPRYADSNPTNLGIKRVNWSPPFQAPFEAGIGQTGSTSLRSFIAASHAYEKLLSSEENLYEYRLNEGECVIFDNRRVLHARKAFDATKGERWLKGAYVDDDVFFSKLRVLQEKAEGKWVADGVERHAVR